MKTFLLIALSSPCFAFAQSAVDDCLHYAADPVYTAARKYPTAPPLQRSYDKDAPGITSAGHGYLVLTQNNKIEVLSAKNSFSLAGRGCQPGPKLEDYLIQRLKALSQHYEDSGIKHQTIQSSAEHIDSPAVVQEMENEELIPYKKMIEACSKAFDGINAIRSDLLSKIGYSDESSSTAKPAGLSK